MQFFAYKDLFQLTEFTALIMQSMTAWLKSHARLLQHMYITQCN